MTAHVNSEFGLELTGHTEPGRQQPSLKTQPDAGRMREPLPHSVYEHEPYHTVARGKRHRHDRCLRVLSILDQAST